MKTLSFSNVIYQVKSQIRWFWGGIRSGWLINRFYFFPTEENLFISFWFDHAHYRRVVPNNTVYDFLDSRVRYMEERVANPDGDRKVRTLERSLLKALYHEPVRKIVVEFLESPSPKENYRPVMKMIRRAWRLGDGSESKVQEVELEGHAGETVEDDDGIPRLLHARTYVVAVQIHHELQGKEPEFETLSRCLPDLRSFIREHFGVEKLPGRLEDFKGYSYKEILKGKSSAKKGQLRAPFKQIIKHPEIFGEDVAARAQKVFQESFK